VTVIVKISLLIQPLLLFAIFLSGCGGPLARMSREIPRGGVVALPDGPLEINGPLTLPVRGKKVELVGGKNTVLRPGPKFQGRALIVCRECRDVTLRGFDIEGSPDERDRPAEAPPSDIPLAQHFSHNGVLLEGAQNVVVTNVKFREIPGMAILVSRSKNVKIDGISVSDCGSKNARGRNNTSGGVLFEEGTQEFEVSNSTFKRVSGNAVWTHSLYRSERNARGLIEGNHFELIARDAIQVGHATQVRVINNTGKMIGYPVQLIDLEGGGIPVGVDTAGKVDDSIYKGNKFEEVNGKCFDLDGFHDGEVSGNQCLNRNKVEEYPNGHFGLVMNNTFPEMRSQLITIRDNVFDGMKMGGIFIIGQGHKLINNKLLNLNRQKCGPSSERSLCVPYILEPEMLMAGIYLGQKAERTDPTTDAEISGNEITGFGMAGKCVVLAPNVTVKENRIMGNQCRNVE
jgi:hypothetical protein